MQMHQAAREERAAQKINVRIPNVQCAYVQCSLEQPREPHAAELILAVVADIEPARGKAANN